MKCPEGFEPVTVSTVEGETFTVFSPDALLRAKLSGPDGRATLDQLFAEIRDLIEATDGVDCVVWPEG